MRDRHLADIIAKREQARQDELQRKREEAAMQKAAQHAELYVAQVAGLYQPPVPPTSRGAGWDRRGGRQ